MAMQVFHLKKVITFFFLTIVDLRNVSCFTATCNFTGYMNVYSHGSDSRNPAKEYSSYNNPSIDQQPELVPPEEKLPYIPTPEAERPVNGKPIEWDPEDLNTPLVFPLKPIYQWRDPAMPQPGSIQLQSTSLNAASSNGILDSLSSDDSTYYASVTDYYEPASIFTSQPDLWQPEPAGRGYGGADLSSESPIWDFKSGYSADSGGSNSSLVFEEVFQFPSEYTGSSQLDNGADSNTAGYIQANYMSKESLTGSASVLDKLSFPSNAASEESQPVYEPGMQSSFQSSFTDGENLSFDQTSYKSHSQPSWLPQEPVITNQKEVSQTEDKQDQNDAIEYQGRYLPMGIDGSK